MKEEWHLPGTALEHRTSECDGSYLCNLHFKAAEIHPLSNVESNKIAGEVVIWRWCNIGPEVEIKRGTKIGSCVEIWGPVLIGRYCKIQSGAKIYGPGNIGDHCYIGPNAVITNDRYPNAKQVNWKASHGTTVLEENVSLGCSAVVLPGLRLCKGAVVGAGAVVTHGILAGQTWVGVPAHKLIKGELADEDVDGGHDEIGRVTPAT